MTDVLGCALLDFFNGQSRGRLFINNRYGAREEMPVSVYFRQENTMTVLELIALEACCGNVLDVGAGAGCHTLVLQQRSFKVKALDVSAGAVEVMRKRGVNRLKQASVFSYHSTKYNTLLLLMNGIGLAGNIAGLQKLLQKMHTMLKPGGQILFDSSDVAYLYKNIIKPTHYYGELSFQYEYAGLKSEWFNWLYIDEVSMHAVASSCGFTMQVLHRDKHQQYLARLT